MALVENYTKTQIILSNGDWVTVPDGVDPKDYRHLKETGLKMKAASANRISNRQRRNSTGRRNSKSVNYAELVIAGAMLETVERVNAPKPDPTLDENIIVIHSAGGTAFMDRETGKVSYA